MFVETGGIDPSLDEIPLAVADSRVMDGTCINAGIIEAFSYVANPRLHTIAFLGAAQIDRFGNLNSTCIGDYEHPKVRFSGSGGACDAASLASGFIVFMQHGRRKFVEKLDYLTSPGWLEGGDSRRRGRLRPRRPDRRGHRLWRAQVRRADQGDVPGRDLPRRDRGAGAREHRLRPRRAARRDAAAPTAEELRSCAPRSTRSV